MTNEKQGLLRSWRDLRQSAQVFFLMLLPVILLRFICLIHLSYVISPQARLMRQQERLEGRVQNIDEQLSKLESDKTLMKVQNSHTVLTETLCSTFSVICQHVHL